MTIDFKLDSNHDLAVENFDLVLVSGIDQIMQKIDIRLRFYLGEWFLDTTVGTPYYENILKKDYDVGVLESSFKARILGTEGVDSLVEFDLFLQDTRTLIVTFKAIILGEEVSGEIIL